MLKSNWSIGSCREFGKAHVIRQRLGRVAPRRSVQAHVCLDRHVMERVVAKLEARASR